MYGCLIVSHDQPLYAVISFHHSFCTIGPSDGVPNSKPPNTYRYLITCIWLYMCMLLQSFEMLASSCRQGCVVIMSLTYSWYFWIHFRSINHFLFSFTCTVYFSLCIIQYRIKCGKLGIWTLDAIHYSESQTYRPTLCLSIDTQVCSKGYTVGYPLIGVM